MISFDSVAFEVFQILRSYNYTVKLWDDDGNRVYEPEEARRFYAQPVSEDDDEQSKDSQKKSAGSLFVSLYENGENSSIRLFISKSVDLADIIGLMDTLRTCAVKFTMLFNSREHGREIEPKDFSTLASIREFEETTNMDMLTEGMYGTTRSSYLKMENAKMIVRHSKRVNEEKIGSRSRNIDAIFVENAVGERFLFPTRQLAPARAMTQHINQGGNFYDQVGAQIGRMAQDYSNLAATSSFIGGQLENLGESAGTIRENCRRQMKEMRRCFERLSRATGYIDECQRITEMETSTLNEGDDNLSEEIRAALYLEGHEIDEAAIVAVTEAMKRCKCADEAMAEGEASRALPDDDTVMILGTNIDRGVWDRFKEGEIDLKGKAKVTMADLNSGSVQDAPEFSNVDAKLQYLMAEILPLVADDSLANLLTKVNDDFPTAPASHRAAMRKMVIIAVKAAGGVGPVLATNNDTIREYDEWANRFTPEAALSENDYNDPTSIASGRREQAYDDAAETVCNEFDVDDFLAAKGDEFGWENGDEDLNYDIPYIKRAIASYLENRVMSQFDLELDMDDYVDGVWDEVAARLQGAGYTLNENDMDGEGLEDDDEYALSREDILIPTSQGDDFAREVSDPTQQDGDVERLRALAGLQARW